ncbi:MAG: DUF1015 domain-containing protein [Lachnospiraceae bacterium]|nr:DUF1015 domain-containing protein [Lachnospiraceae bacterium]
MKEERKSAFVPADILIPSEKCDMSKWAVIACDQYTGEPEYWDKVEELTRDCYSAYKLVLPEVYLGKECEDEKLNEIEENMTDYLKNGVFTEYKDALVYLERTDSEGNVRAGILGAIDLEKYDFSKNSKSIVRATEATVEERIPPRLKVRKKAKIELPHVMLLIDDPKKNIIEEVGRRKESMKKLYDFTLMMGGGSIKGWLLDEDAKDFVSESLSLMQGYDEKDSFVFAVGDGNHSLATAKTHYANLKKENCDSKDTELSRYALCEVVNLHSDALAFEAIHRIVWNVDTDCLMSYLKDELGLVEADEKNPKGQVIGVSLKGNTTYYSIEKPKHTLAVGSLQMALDDYVKQNGGDIDYIHGEESVLKMAEREGSIAFVLPDMKKEELFPAVKKAGALPRKTFSMGHADDKRFYLEARKIRTE